MQKSNVYTAHLIFHILSIVLGLIFVLPIIWSLMASLRPEMSVMQGLAPVSLKALIPNPFTLNNYRGVFENRYFTLALINTIYVVIITIVFGIGINALAGFAFAAFRFYGKRILFAIVISSFLLPGDILTIPAYNLVESLGLIDTKAALILPALGNGMVIFMFIQFFKQIPDSIREAALIDGASSLQILLRIYVPLTIPTMIGGSLMLFIMQWEAFLWPLVVSRSVENQMIQVALSTFNQQYQTAWGQVLGAATLLCFIPLFILMPLQKYYVSSVTSGAIKG